MPALFLGHRDLRPLSMIPMTDADGVAPQQTLHDDAGAAGRPAVLYVEDHPVNVMLMEALFLRRPAWRLVVATDGQSALRAVEDLAPVLLLLDLGLPDCHGSELLAALRRLPQTATTPAVAVTADDQFVVASSDFLELWLKPLNLAAVMRRLDALCAPDMGRPDLPLRRYRETPGPGLPDGRMALSSAGGHP